MKYRRIFIRTVVVLVFTVVLLVLISGRDGVKDEPRESPSTPAETTMSTPDPLSGEELIRQRAREILAEMSLAEKVYQMMIVCPESISGAVVETAAGEDFTQGLATRPVGGVVLFASNVVSGEQLESFIADAQGAAELGLFIAVDEEGGSVSRVARQLDTTKFLDMFEYRDQGEETAYQNAMTIAVDIKSFGFNLNFAPVADVWTNPQNRVIGRRAYSDDAEEASVLVAAAVRGFYDGGIIPCIKHFPGHGDTHGDTHLGEVYSASTVEELRSRELLPFAAGIKAGCEMVMVSHITMTEIDPDYPSVVSSKIIIDILRKELEFDGVVITDSLEMGALSKYTPAEAAVMAVTAGVDILLQPADIDQAALAVMEEISEERIDDSVMRILCLKLKNGIIPLESSTGEEDGER